MRFLFNNYKLVQRLIHIISAVVFIASCLFMIWLYQHGYLTNQAKLQTLVGQDRFLGALFFTLLPMMQVVVPIVPIGFSCHDFSSSCWHFNEWHWYYPGFYYFIFTDTLVWKTILPVFRQRGNLQEI